MQAKRKTGSGWKKEKYFHESKDWIKMYKTISDNNAPSMKQTGLCDPDIFLPDPNTNSAKNGFGSLTKKSL